MSSRARYSVAYELSFLRARYWRGSRFSVRGSPDRSLGASHHVQPPVQRGFSRARRHRITGSSIFRFWTHLTDQMAPLPVLNRAIAGTVTQDMLDRIGQLVLPYQPRIVVYYCGSNDISAGEDAGPIIERTKRYIQILHEKSPDTFFYYTSIQKAPEK